MRKQGTRAAGLVLAVALTAAACSTKADDEGNTPAGSGDPSELTTDFGVTDDTITLGILTDLTGPFAALSTAIVQGNELVYDKINADGGICDRQIELIIEDHGYDVQRAVQLYAQVEPDVLGMTQLIGSPMTTALLETITETEMVTAPASWASTLLENPYILMAGTTYDLEMINGLQYMVDEGLIADGDTIGALYVEGEYGANGFAGVEFAAKALGLTVESATLKATDTDATSVISQFAQAGVAAIALTTTPTQTASAVGVAAQALPGVKFLGNNPTFSPGLLATPVAAALEANFLLAASALPFTADTPEMDMVRTEFAEAYPDEPGNGGVTYGYGVATIYSQILRTACESGDMTRAGLLAALQATDEGITGVIAPLDFSQPGSPASREIYIAAPDAAAEGGLTIVKDLFTTELAGSYTAPAEG
ncbi:MAG: ABC transporter substrate-binding protein [Geodermatophilaceae bacterium]|nr:ABC transporter substrate-binding protein [Geodermatophilaceae bacterium]